MISILVGSFLIGLFAAEIELLAEGMESMLIDYSQRLVTLRVVGRAIVAIPGRQKLCAFLLLESNQIRGDVEVLKVIEKA